MANVCTGPAFHLITWLCKSRQQSDFGLIFRRRSIGTGLLVSLLYVIESVKSIHACHTRLLQMMLSQDSTDIDCTCMKLARIRIVEIINDRDSYYVH